MKPPSQAVTAIISAVVGGIIGVVASNLLSTEPQVQLNQAMMLDLQAPTDQLSGADTEEDMPWLDENTQRELTQLGEEREKILKERATSKTSGLPWKDVDRQTKAVDEPVKDEDIRSFVLSCEREQIERLRVGGDASDTSCPKTTIEAKRHQKQP
jgi:hypothetical protein